MKIIILIENTTKDPRLTAEHGLSLYIETKRHRILFDTGQSGVFADNAKALGVDLKNIDFAVLSHGHYDHGGGIARFLTENKTAPIYMNEHAFGEYYNGVEKYIGLDPMLATRQDRLVLTGDALKIADGVQLFTCNDRAPAHKVDSAGLLKRAGEQLIADDFLHEQYLLLEEEGRKVLISGCSHKGVLNVMDWVKPDVLVGGFHFSKIEPEWLAYAAEALKQYPCTYYTCHCTGIPQFQYLQGKIGGQLRYLGTGDVVEV